MTLYVAQSWGISTFPAQGGEPAPAAPGVTEIPDGLAVTGTVSSAGLKTTPPAVTTPAVPAASTPVTNSTGLDVMVYVAGGTAVAVSVGGTATGLAAGAFYLPAGAQISLGAYTAAPSWAWIPA
jgi:hypothetical protein